MSGSRQRAITIDERNGDEDHVEMDVRSVGVNRHHALLAVVQALLDNSMPNRNAASGSNSPGAKNWIMW